MGQAFEITIFNRYTGKNEVEKVYGHNAVEFAYNTPIGKFLAPIVASRLVSRIYGNKQDSSNSAKKVLPFIQDFQIKIDDYQKGSLEDNEIINSYKSFNEFFIRKFVDGKREFTAEADKMGAFSEARYFGYEKITDNLTIPVKGTYLKAKDLIGNSELAKDFEGGPLMIARLCPVDYHRYHYPDNGKTINAFSISGDFHSVNPIALKHRGDIFIKNERRVSIIETENFVKVAYIEVGSTSVGKIVQSFDENKKFEKGDEKGYFLFGGSTVVILGEPGKWKPSLDIIKNTLDGIETYIHLGDEVALK
jgi:phosphatidylserine decarboxylase